MHVQSQDIMEITEGMADDSSIGRKNSSGNLGEQVITPCMYYHI